MIPVEIITKEEAIVLGILTYDDKSGEAIAGAGCIASGKIGQAPDKFLEKVIFKKNGEKELIFMHEERKEELKKRNQLANYLNQFDKIEGKEKATFLKENNLIPMEFK